MKKSILMILLAALLLCGCGLSTGKENTDQSSTSAPEAAGTETAEPTPSPTPTPAPTPTPVPELSFPDGSVHKADETELDLKKLSHKDVAETAELLRQMPDLQTIDLGTDGAWTGVQPELND